MRCPNMIVKTAFTMNVDFLKKIPKWTGAGAGIGAVGGALSPIDDKHTAGGNILRGAVIGAGAGTLGNKVRNSKTFNNILQKIKVERLKAANPQEYNSFMDSYGHLFG